MTRLCTAAIAALVYCVLLLPEAAAQTATTGAIIGTVSDPSGAVTPKAEIQLTNLDTNAADKTVTNDAGQFVFATLNPGHYRITVKLAGFRTAWVANLVVEVNKSLNVPVGLEVGADNQIVEVAASATAMLQTIDAQIGNTIQTDAI